MTRVILRNSEGMRLNGRPPSNISAFSDDEDAVHSGSATGFSDGDPEESSQSKAQRKSSNPFDPVNTILDKIDAELVSLTRSQSSTATDSTVVHRPHSQPSSSDHSKLESGEGLTISQLGSIHPRSFSPPGMMRTGSSDRDTGFGTGNSSYRDDSLQQRRAPSPEMVFQNGRHVYQDVRHGRHREDDQSSRGPDAGTALNSKQIDDKFKEIMQKRKGGYMSKGSGNEDAETIRTEDFVDRFQDTMVYSSADEQERLKNLEEDISDGGSDTDTLQRKLAILTSTSLPEDRSLTRPFRPFERQRRKLTPSIETRASKGTQGTPPVYPKPTPTTTLPRPSRGGFKMSSGFTSDADSVRTEDFESHFNNMMVNPTGESDQDGVTNDPIHARVKQLLKATAKYEDTSYNRYSYPLTTSILKQSYTQDKPHKAEPYKSKQHVRIATAPHQFEEQDKGEDSDETLCSDKEDGTSDWQSPDWEANLPPRYSLDLDSPWDHDILTDRKAPLKKISSADDSASKTSSLSSFSISSGEKDRETRKHGPNEHSVAYIGHPCMQPYSRQISSSSAATSVSEYPSSDYLDTAANSRSTSTSESMLGDTEAGMLHEMQIRFRDREIHDRSNYPQYYIDGTQRYSGDIIGNPYGGYSHAKPSLQNRERNKQQKKHDLIVPDEEEEFPFAKHTFNKKPDKNKQLNSVNFADRNYSKNSISSKSLMDQYHLLHGMPSKRLTNSSSSSSLFSSMTSNSFTEYSSPDDMNLGDSYDFDWQRAHQGSFSHSNMNFPRVHPMYLQNGGKMMPGLSPYPGAEFGASQISPSPIDNSTSKAEQILSSLGFGETQNLVPERFLRSWVSKMVQSQQKEREIQQQQLAMAYQPYFMYPESLYDDNDIPPSVSAQQSGTNTPRWRHSLENIHTNHPPATRSLASHRRVFRRAHSLNPMLNDSARFGNTSAEDMVNSESDRDSEFGSIGALPVSKENSFDKLKKILQNRETLSKEIRRSTFSSNRQKSLPLFLETLTEEDEAKCRSRSPSIEKAVDNRERRPSQMKYFFQEEERRSCTASESEPENSRKSSLNEPRLSEVIHNLKDSIAEMSEAESLSSNDTGQSGSDKVNSPERRNKILQLPSIIVSERVDSENNSPKNVERASVLRPVSPHPENQPKAKEDIYSKDSLEIAEIMNTSDKGGSAQAFRPVLDSIPSPSSDTFKSVSIKRVDGSTIASPNSRFLKIVPDTDDKSLSPSSINSPLGLSPVTVIEMAKLDNQNDSLETEDSLPKASGSASKGSSKSLSVRKQCLSPVSSNKPTASLNSHSLIIDTTPKSLSLERRSYERETKAAFDIDSIDEIDDKICVEYKEKEIQTTDDTLPPIVNISDISSVMHFFIRNLPLHGQNLFYLAQDRETQYEAPLMKPNESGDISNEDSDRLDSGIISNQSSNESGSRLSPLQVSNSCSSKVKCEMHVMPGSVGVGNNSLNAVDSSLSFLHDRNKIGDFNEHDIDKNKQDNTKETVYRTEALIEIGTYDLKNSFQLAKRSKASTQPSSENIKPQSENATDFEQRICEREMQLQTDTQNLERHAMNISRSLADNRNSVNDMNSYSIMKKNVTFSMTDSQEEKETTRKKSFKRIEKNRSTFHKYSSFNKEAMSNIYENSDQENDHCESANDANFFIHNEIENSKYPDKTCKQNVLSVLNFTFGDVGTSANVKFKTERSEHSIILDPASVYETHGEVHRPEDAEKSDSLEQRISLENLQHECMADLTSQSKQLIIDTSDRSLEQATSFEYMANNVPKETMTGTEPQKLSIESCSEHLQSSKLTDADHFSIEGRFFSKSLDFNTVGSRRANFKKCDGATFSKSFDSSSDLSGSFSSQEQIQEEFRQFSLSEPVDKSIFMKPTINNADDRFKEEQNFGEEIRQEFLGIDLTEIDKFCDIENLEILDDIDEECEELERFIDSYSGIDHANLSWDKESDILVDDIKTEDFEAESFEVDDINTEDFEAESLGRDIGNNLFEQNYTEGQLSMDELVNNNYISGDSLVKYSMTDLDDTENIIDTDKQTNKNVKIKTFHLGKNTVNMTTFGNYNCNDQAFAGNINVTVTDVDNKVHQAMSRTDLTKLDKHFSVMKSIPEESAVIDESEKMKKIKELYKSLSFGEIEDFGFANNLIEAHDSQYQSYKTFSEKIDNNLTFEEIFAHNFEYLEHENNSEEDVGDQMGLGLFTDETVIEEELNKTGPAVNFVTHNCLNCGHKVTVAMHIDESYQEDHDFCVQCSPIDISVENLERRRKEKHKDNPYIY